MKPDVGGENDKYCTMTIVFLYKPHQLIYCVLYT